MKWHTGVLTALLILSPPCSPLLLAAAPGTPLAQAHKLLSERAASNAQALGARIEVHIDPNAQQRLSQAPCSPQAFLPASTRLWGKIHVGFRCTSKPWQIRVPAQVAMLAQVPVLTRPITAGSVLQDGDWALAEIDIAAWPRGVSLAPERLVGAKAGRALRAGEPIPPDALKSHSRLSAGDPVQVTLLGTGFTVKATGKVMQAASPGQSIRVKLDSGPTVSGVLRDDREIEVTL